VKKTAVVTGASAGIGAAIATALAKAGYDVVAGARRVDRLKEVTDPIGARALALDVRDRASVESFAAQLGEVHVLINNAGLSLGLDKVGEATDESWRTMWETNVLGVMHMTRALLPKLIASGAGHIVNIGSVAGFETYPGGAGYTASKHGLRAVTKTLRLELLGQPVRVTDVSPGLAETEFSLVRFGGDSERAAGVYNGLQPLVGSDVAECVTWVLSRPAHVNIDEIVVRPLAQATATLVHRQTPQT
jgi:NADP-dependent 3-hydroxy acid dehydrogenase YdfG